MDPCTITVQPAGPVGKRHVFVTLAFEDDNDARQIELVLSERPHRQSAGPSTYFRLVRLRAGCLFGSRSGLIRPQCLATSSIPLQNSRTSSSLTRRLCAKPSV